MNRSLNLSDLQDTYVEIEWKEDTNIDAYNIYWADRNTDSVVFKLLESTGDTSYRLKKSTHVPHYLKVAGVEGGKEVWMSDVLQTDVKNTFTEQLEKLSRGLVAVKTHNGIFLSWRLMLPEVTGYSETGLTGTDFLVFKNGKWLAEVNDSTNYLDTEGSEEDLYHVESLQNGQIGEQSEQVRAWTSGDNYIDIPIQAPEGGITPTGQAYTYNANDMSVGDVDGDSDYEYIVKWDPTNSHDVSHKGYTGHCYIDCYKLDGRLLWRLDMGCNIRAGAHYTQFMVFDFDGDGKAEMSVKTAPGTKMTTYNHDGTVNKVKYITIPEKDMADGVSNSDNYVCSAEDYRNHLVDTFMRWHDHPEVIAGHWPGTLEACFGIDNKYTYPLNRSDAVALVAYFIEVYAKDRSEKNQLDQFEGFIFKGPEYLTMFGGDGEELQTIDFPFPRQDDGLLWGDYAMKRIEPCNRVDRFLSGVGYLDGEHPSLIIARGYYTRSTIAAYRFEGGQHVEQWRLDSGHVPMANPFCAQPHESEGSDPVYGRIAGQGNHSLATADVDGDGCHEIIYGGCVIDQDGSVLYSSYDIMPDGSIAKLGHGDAMHVAKIDPGRPGYQIFNVFEGGIYAPYGYALRDAEDGKVIFGEFAEVDLGRCMIGDIDPDTPGYQCWVGDTYDCKGNKLDVPLLGTNMNIRWAADMSTQITDGVDFVGGNHRGIINDNTHGIMMAPEGVMTNNGTKGNPCLVADIFGDFREELLVRTEDNKAIRIYLNTDVTEHKLFTLMHDIQYRAGVAWQNNCYNQPCYPKFYYGSDMDWAEVLPRLKVK